jgi:hypothetical protein
MSAVHSAFNRAVRRALDGDVEPWGGQGRGVIRRKSMAVRVRRGLTAGRTGALTGHRLELATSVSFSEPTLVGHTLLS